MEGGRVSSSEPGSPAERPQISPEQDSQVQATRGPIMVINMTKVIFSGGVGRKAREDWKSEVVPGEDNSFKKFGSEESRDSGGTSREWSQSTGTTPGGVDL